MPAWLIPAAVSAASAALGSGKSSQNQKTDYRPWLPGEGYMHNEAVSGIRDFMGRLSGPGVDIGRLTADLYEPAKADIMSTFNKTAGNMMLGAGKRGGPSSIFRSEQRKLGKATGRSLSEAQTNARLGAEQVATSSQGRNLAALQALQQVYSAINAARNPNSTTITQPGSFMNNLASVGGNIGGMLTMQQILKGMG